MKFLKVMLALSSALLISGCASHYTLSYEDYFGLDSYPTYTAGMPVEMQNSQVMEKLGEAGFETNEVEKGVVVYLPPHVHFKQGGSKLGLDAREKIAEVAAEINKDYLSRRNIEVVGHTDSSGESSVNMGLSKARSEAVTQEMVFSRVDKSRLTTLWYGETQPRFKEINDDGSVNKRNRELNRRVEFIILNPA